MIYRGQNFETFEADDGRFVRSEELECRSANRIACRCAFSAGLTPLVFQSEIPRKQER